MSEAIPPNNQAVADLWFRWLEAVRKIVEPALASRKMAPQDYRTLHNALVKGCQDSDTTDEDLVSNFEKIKRIVAPWVTYDSLASADRRFLNDVLKQAELINTKMKSLTSTPVKVGRSRKGRKQLQVLFVAFAIGLGGGAFIIMGDATPDTPIRYDIQQLMLRAKFAMRRFSTLQIFGAVSGLLLLFAGPLMYRTKKS